MSEPRKPSLSPAQQVLSDVWDEHLTHEFATKNTNDTLDTMVEDAYVNHVPVLTGGSGRDELQAFYSTYFIPQMPSDMTIVPVSRTIGVDRLVDESVARFTHSIQMDWLLPGIAPTGKPVEVALVVVVEFRDGRLAGERIYWDQASVLVQLGLLDASALPVAGVESARKVLDQTIPSNQLIERANQGG
jgi:carboxymethylenebutenolidase